MDRGEVQWHFPAKGSGVLARDVRDPSQSPRYASHRPSVKESTGALSEDGRTLGWAVPAPGRGSGAHSRTLRRRLSSPPEAVGPMLRKMGGGETPQRTGRAGEESAPTSSVGVDLYWLPLGAGGHFVRLNGRLYEAVIARLARRPVRDLYHSALEVRVPEGRFVIESAPIRAADDSERGVVAEGAVGSRWAGSIRIFRYELRFWRDGFIPDVAEAVESPRRLTDDPERARRLLALAPHVPTPVWGRDELHAGEMWNSNSVIAWLIARSGLDTGAIRPPAGGRAPGWDAGLVVARRA